MTLEQAAGALGVGRRTAERDWTFARTWLFRQLRAPDDRNTFSTYFRFRITDSGGIVDGAGADGLVFVIQTDSNAVGGGGAGIGYAGISPSVGIEFDTYDNMGIFTDNDPGGNHVGINVNGSISSIALASEPTRFNDGEIWNAWVDYDGATNGLEIRWSPSSLRPLDSQLSATLDLLEVLGQGTAFLGFTSGTAAAWGNHDLLGWEYRDRFSPIAVIPEPGTFAMVAGGLVIAGVLGHAQNVRRRPRSGPNGG